MAEVLLRCDCGWQVQAELFGGAMVAATNTRVMIQHWKRGHVVECREDLVPHVRNAARNIADGERIDALFQKLKDGIGKL